MHEDTLARVDLFRGLDKKDLRLLAASCQERKYSAGSTLMKQGDTGVGLYVITSGKVRVTRASSPDRAEEELDVVGVGSVLGEMALLDDLPRSATVTTLQSHPDIAIRLLAVLSRRLRKAENRSPDQ